MPVVAASVSTQYVRWNRYRVVSRESPQNRNPQEQEEEPQNIATNSACLVSRLRYCVAATWQ